MHDFFEILLRQIIFKKFVIFPPLLITQIGLKLGNVLSLQVPLSLYLLTNIIFYEFICQFQNSGNQQCYNKFQLIKIYFQIKREVIGFHFVTFLSCYTLLIPVKILLRSFVLPLLDRPTAYYIHWNIEIFFLKKYYSKLQSISIKYNFENGSWIL